MKDSTSLAIRSDVPFGNAEIEGYFLPEKLWTKTNKFGVSKTQAVILVYPELDRKYGASKYTEIVKSKTCQTVTTIEFFVHRKLGVEGANEKVDLLPLDLLIPFLKVCKKLGSVAADELIDDLAGLSLQQLFSDAFKVKFDEDKRQQWLKDRDEGKQVRHSLTDVIAWYLERNETSDNKRHWIYINCSDAVNIGLFGRRASKLCVDFKVIDRSKLRDYLTTDELRWLSEIEDLASRLIMYQEYEPITAVKEAISRLAILKVDRTA